MGFTRVHRHGLANVTPEWTLAGSAPLIAA